jgi:nucleotide-binding universal stress UspA family protein
MISRREYGKRAKEEAQKVLDRVVAKAAAAGVDAAGVHAIAASPWEAILACAKKSKCDAIVMASHGRRGLAGLLLGSETTKVLTHSKLPVLVVR